MRPLRITPGPARARLATAALTLALLLALLPGPGAAEPDGARDTARGGVLSSRLDTILDSPAARRALGIAAPASPADAAAPPAPAGATAPSQDRRSPRSPTSPDTAGPDPTDARRSPALANDTAFGPVGRDAGWQEAGEAACLPAGDGDADRRVVIGTTEEDARMLDALARMGRERADAESAGIAARERIAANAARQRLEARVVRRRVPHDVAAVFDDILVDCDAVADVTRLFAAWRLGEPADAAVPARSAGRQGPPPAWRAVSARLLAAPMAMRHLLAERMAERLVLAGRLGPLLLLEPMLPPPDSGSRARLVAAHLDLLHGRIDAGRAALAGLVREDGAAGQVAAVLLAERLDPMSEMPLAMGWIGHLDLVGAIAFEHAGTRFGRRAARAEIRLTARALGRAAALRALSLSHARGLLETGDMQRMAQALWAAEDAPPDPLPLPLWAAADPASFAALASPPAEAGAAARPASGAAPDARERGDGAVARPAPSDWRGRVSVAGGAAAPPRQGGAEPASARIRAEPQAGAAVAPPERRLPEDLAGAAGASRPTAGAGDLLAETDRLLERITDDMNAAEALLEDG